MKPQEVLALCREKDVKAVDLRFMDFPGLWQHFTIPVNKLDLDVFEDGLGFDGSSIRGWQAINESDMLVVPQPETAFLDPFTTLPTLVMICNIQDPITREDYSRDPRNVARKAVNYLKSTQIGDICFIGPEAEFFIFDDVRFDQNQHEGYFHIDSIEGEWNRGPCTVLVLASDLTLQVPAKMIATHLLACVMLCVGLSAIAVGMGARLPSLREESPSKIAAGYGGTLNLVISTIYITAVVGLSAGSYHLYMIAGIGRVTVAWCLAGSFAIAAAATIVPLKIGIQAFRELEF